jgi:hypothetical protein
MRLRSWPCLLVLLAAGCMEQAKPNPLARRPTLYARLNGEPFLAGVVDDFVAGVIKAGPEGPLGKSTWEFFERGGDPLKRELVEELGAALGGPQPPRRDRLLEMFRAAGPQHAPQLEERLADSFAKNKAPARDVEDVRKVLAGLRKEALGKKEEG